MKISISIKAQTLIEQALLKKIVESGELEKFNTTVLELSRIEYRFDCESFSSANLITSIFSYAINELRK